MLRQRMRRIIGAAIGLTVLALAGCTVVINPASSISYLSSLSPSAGSLSPAFSYAVTSYTITLDNASGGMSFVPITQDGGATVTVNGVAVTSGTSSATTCLNVGTTTTFTIVVTAANLVTTSVYYVYVTADYMKDTFTRSDTSGMDLGSDWTVYGSGADKMRIDSNCVNSSFVDSANTYGVWAVYNGDVDYSSKMYAAMQICIPSTAYATTPDIVGGIEICSSSVTDWSGYYCEIEHTTAGWRLYVSEYPTSTNYNYAGVSINADTWYLLELVSDGATITANLYDTSGTSLIQAVSISDSPRTYSTGDVVFYNYMEKNSYPTGGSLYLDDFEIYCY